MPTECNTDLFGFARVENRRVEASFDAGLATSDAGALLLGSTDQVIGLIDRFSECFEDNRSEGMIEHTVKTLVGQRVVGIAMGHEDLNDHDHLRHDPVMAVMADKLAAKRSDCAPVAGKSTLNRLELSSDTPTRYHKIIHDPSSIEALFVTLFLEAHSTPPAQIILDLDATDDPLHGDQEGRFFHGYYDCYCYLPLYIFCGQHLLAAKLRRSNIDAAAGAVDEVARLVAQIRAHWPEVRVILRADSGFARDELMSAERGATRGARTIRSTICSVWPATRGWWLSWSRNWRGHGRGPRPVAERRGTIRTSCGRRATVGAAGAGLSPRRNGCPAEATRAPTRASW